VELVGYPQADLTEEEIWRTFTVHAATRSAVQLDWADVGSFVGHSGGPVLDADSGKLAGILREGSSEGRFDRYLPLWRLVEGGVLARLPWLVDGDDAEGHFARRSQGRRGSAGRDIFTGRQAALDRLTGWLTSPEHTGRVLVVTGQPGAGKSAVTARAGLQVACELGRDPRRRGLLFHARSADAAAFRRAVADLFGSGADEAPYALLEDVDRIGTQAPDRRWLLVVDALDEAPRADDREQIATVVEQLARRPWVRAVVATRPLSAQGASGEASLLRRLGIHDAADDHLLNLDNDTYFDETDVEGLAGQLLTQADQAFPIPGTAAETYRADPALRNRLALVIAQTAQRNFLVAGMTASRLADTRTVVDPAAAGFDITALPTSVGGALDQFLDSRQDGAQLRGVLTALAYAEGTGMDDHTWLTITGALGYPTTQAGLDSLRATPIADYLLQSTTEADGRVIRLFHQALVDQLRRHRDEPCDQDAITTALIDDGRRRGWANTARYTLRHLPAHADAAGRTGQLLPDLDFLLHADLADVRRTLTAPQSGQSADVAAVLLSAGAAADELAPDQRAPFLALHAAHLGLPGVMHGFNARTTAGWRPLWGHSLGSHRTTLEGHTGAVNAVAALPLPDGRVLLASGGDDAMVRLWDPVTGTPASSPLEGHTGPVYAVAAVPMPDGRVLLASGGRDGTVRLWDPATGTPAGNPLEGHTSSVFSVAAVPLPDGRVLLASGGHDGTVRLWDPVTRTPASSPVEGHTGAVFAVAAVPMPDGRVLLATGVGDGTVRLWDLATGTPAGRPLGGHTGAVHAVAAVPLPDGRVLLAAGGETTLRLWDPATGTPVGNPLHGHTSAMHAVAAVPLPDGQVLLATAGRDRTVRLWDLATGTPAGSPVEGHTGPVYAVAAVPMPDGRVLLATGGDDGTVRLWDLATGTPAGNPLEGHTGPVYAVAAVPMPDGRMLLATGGRDCTVRLWDPATREALGGPLIGHIDFVNAVAAVPLPGGRVLLASGGGDGTVQLWDPVTGTPAGDPLRGHTNTVTAVAAVLMHDERVLLASSSYDGTVRLWDPATGTPAGSPLEGHTGPVHAVAAVPLPDGRVLLASGSDYGTVRLWDPVTGTRAGSPLEGHTGVVTAVAAVPVPEGRILLASAGNDRTVRLWDPTIRTLVGVIRLAGPAHSLTATYSHTVAGVGRGLAAFAIGLPTPERQRD
jgi:WD40 repeat protein